MFSKFAGMGLVSAVSLTGLAMIPAQASVDVKQEYASIVGTSTFKARTGLKVECVAAISGSARTETYTNLIKYVDAKNDWRYSTHSAAQGTYLMYKPGVLLEANLFNLSANQRKLVSKNTGVFSKHFKGTRVKTSFPTYMQNLTVFNADMFVAPSTSDVVSKNTAGETTTWVLGSDTSSGFKAGFVESVDGTITRSVQTYDGGDADTTFTCTNSYVDVSPVFKPSGFVKKDVIENYGFDGAYYTDAQWKDMFEYRASGNGSWRKNVVKAARDFMPKAKVSFVRAGHKKYDVTVASVYDTVVVHAKVSVDRYIRVSSLHVQVSAKK